MNLAALPELLLALVRGQSAARPATGEGLPFKPGQVYEGKVLDALGNGRHLVQVADRRLDMAMPREARSGDSVRLTFLHAGPRPTFLLHQATSSAQPVSLSQAAQQVGALMRMAQAAGPTNPVGNPVPGAAGNPAPASATVMPTAAGAATQPPVGTRMVVTAASTATPTPTPMPTRGLPIVVPGPVPGAAVPVAPGPAPVAMANPPPASAGSALVAGIAHAMSRPDLAAAPATRAPAMPSPGVTSSAATSQSQNQPGPGQIAAASAQVRANVIASETLLQGYGAAARANAAPPPGVNSGLLGQAVEAARATLSTRATLDAARLAETSDPARAALPARLSRVVGESGLFYESHLARWSRGASPLDAILREPQARLARAETAGARLAELGGMPEEAARLAGRQLLMLEGQPFFWQGLAWPGQAMEWLIREHAEGGEGGADGEDDSDWSTELKLSLPRLGSVHVHLGLAGERVRLRLAATEEPTREAMRVALPDLVKGLEAAGLKPVSLAVESGRDD